MIGFLGYAEDSSFLRNAWAWLARHSTSDLVLRFVAKKSTSVVVRSAFEKRADLSDRVWQSMISTPFSTTRYQITKLQNLPEAWRWMLLDDEDPTCRRSILYREDTTAAMLRYLMFNADKRVTKNSAAEHPAVHVGDVVDAALEGHLDRAVALDVIAGAEDEFYEWAAKHRPEIAGFPVEWILPT